MREPTEMELRVARAIADTTPLMLSAMPIGLRGRFCADAARAAIRAMREPNDMMLQAQSDTMEHHYFGDGVYDQTEEVRAEAYRAMIDAASPQEPT